MMRLLMRGAFLWAARAARMVDGEPRPLKGKHSLARVVAKVSGGACHWTLDRPVTVEIGEEVGADEERGVVLLDFYDAPMIWIPDDAEPRPTWLVGDVVTLDPK